MSRVAIAGGLGDLGRALLDGILETTPHHSVFLLTRKSTSGKGSKGRAAPENVPILEVDYSSVDDIVGTMQRHSIDTVISVLNLDFEEISDAQINLIRGAAKSGVVKRFIPSDFNVDYSLPDSILSYPDKVYHQRARAELEKHPDIASCSIQVGMFMDYYGIPHVETYLKPLTIMIDIPHQKAAIAGDGNALMACTFSKDVGYYVAALLDTPAEMWPKDAICVGERLSANSLLQMAEKVTGSSFDVTYDRLSDLDEHRATELPSNIPLYPFFPEGKSQVNFLASCLGVSYARGAYDIKGVSLNDMFPNIQPKRMEEMLRSCWATKHHL